MTTPYLLADLERDEGLRLEAYPDPLSGAEPWTIGYGHCGREVHQGLVWTPAQAKMALQEDVANAETGLSTALPWWPTLDDPRQDVLVNMAFNLGVHGLLAFHDTLKFVSEGNYDAAADAMLESKWAKQVPLRAQRLARQMRSGVVV